jgi:drug/metabolite transporter (DMT)-like permease
VRRSVELACQNLLGGSVEHILLDESCYRPLNCGLTRQTKLSFSFPVRKNIIAGLDRRRILAYIEVTLAVLAWGGSFVATKVALQEITPAAVVWLRFGIGLMILGAAVIIRRQFILPERKDLAYLVLLGFIGITFHQWLQSTGLQTAQATTTAWIVATTPVFMALLGWMILKERLARTQLAGIALAAFGVLLVVSNGNLSSIGLGQFGTWGDFLVLLSALNWAVFSALSRRGLMIYKATPMLFYVMGFGWLFSSLWFFSGTGLGQLTQLSRDGWLAIAFLGVFCSGLAYIFWYDALQNMPVAQAGAFLYTEPFVTVVVAGLILGESMLWSSLLGGGLILVGVILVQSVKRARS